MNLGKVSDVIYKRAIAKQLKISETDMVFEEKTVFGSDKQIGIFAIASVMNRLKVRQVETLGVYVKIFESATSRDFGGLCQDFTAKVCI